MNDPETAFALRWFEKAKNDLITAQQTLALLDGPTDTPCFHAQQAVEKSLKALLTAEGVAFPRTHDLMPLLELARAVLPDLERFRNAFAELTDYAVEVRYPGDFIDPSREDAQAALETARQVVEMVRVKLPGGGKAWEV